MPNRFVHIGNIDLLQRQLTGVFSSRLINPQSVIPALDWAAEQALNADATIISGFQSALEKKILAYLLSGKCGIVLVLARSLYKQVPQEYAEAIADDRMLILSLSGNKQTGKQSAIKRNELIAAKAESLVIISLHPGSSLQNLYNTYKNKSRLI